ncbi:hypothetical protein ILYODFUR_037461, partial [Ilyodon furcidens]
VTNLRLSISTLVQQVTLFCNAKVATFLSALMIVSLMRNFKTCKDPYCTTGPAPQAYCSISVHLTVKTLCLRCSLLCCQFNQLLEETQVDAVAPEWGGRGEAAGQGAEMLFLTSVSCTLAVCL